VRILIHLREERTQDLSEEKESYLQFVDLEFHSFDQSWNLWRVLSHWLDRWIPLSHRFSFGLRL